MPPRKVHLSILPTTFLCYVFIAISRHFLWVNISQIKQMALPPPKHVPLELSSCTGYKVHTHRKLVQKVASTQVLLHVGKLAVRQGKMQKVDNGRRILCGSKKKKEYCLTANFPKPALVSSVLMIVLRAVLATLWVEVCRSMCRQLENISSHPFAPAICLPLPWQLILPAFYL